MIARYEQKDLSILWTDSTRFLTWLRVEHAVCAELAKTKIIPPQDWKKLNSGLLSLIRAGGVDSNRVTEVEKITHHDVIAFTTVVAEKLGPVSRWVHYGLTSSDVVDTGTALQIQQSGDLITRALKELIQATLKRAKETRTCLALGRTHGMAAEPMSFGLKFLGFAEELKRSQARLELALEDLRVGKLSGAVGASVVWTPRFEAQVLNRLGLKREVVSTQVLPRDKHAHLLSVLALLGASIERWSMEVRGLQRSEVGEVLEPFSKGQKGSSAMPHKRNPIASENLTGVARLLRGFALSEMESVALWHERDISHSVVERFIFPDAFGLSLYALRRCVKVISGLELRFDRIQQNLEQIGQVSSSGQLLLALVREGVLREEAYVWMQNCALQSVDLKKPFLTLVLEHPEIRSKLSKKEIEQLCRPEYFLRNVPEIYKMSERIHRKTRGR